MEQCKELYYHPMVLVVEDDESQLELLKDIILEEGFGIVECTRGVEAIQKLNSQSFEVAVVDLNLPDIKAEQFLKALIPFADNTAFIINTGYASYESARDALNIGIFAYVEKANEPEVLLRHIYRACNSRLQRYSQDLERAVEERTQALSQANVQLKVSEENYRNIFETAASLILSVNREGILVDCNNRIEPMLGYTKQEILGESITRIIHLDDINRVRENLSGVLMKRDSYNEEYRMVRKDRGIINVNINASVFRDKQDNSLRTICVVDDITARKKTERERLGYQQKLRSLTLELSLAEERERRRIAAGLHEDACQTLALSKIKLQQLQTSLLLEEDQSLTDICTLLDQTLDSVRKMTFDLSSPTLYRFGLAAALKELLMERFRVEHGIQCIFRDDGIAKPLAEDISIMLFQSVRELLINVVKHARAQEVVLEIARFEDSIRISLTDDGVGFDATDVDLCPSQDHGFGLFNIRERFDFLGGRLEIETQPGKGCRFVLIAPLKTSKEMDQEIAFAEVV